MPEYVDRMAIRDKACTGCTMRDGANGCWNPDPCETLVIEFVSAYAADVAPVVYCKDCVHCGSCGEETSLEEMGFYGFCSRGKRREEMG